MGNGASIRKQGSLNLKHEGSYRRSGIVSATIGHFRHRSRGNSSSDDTFHGTKASAWLSKLRPSSSETSIFRKLVGDKGFRRKSSEDLCRVADSGVSEVSLATQSKPASSSTITSDGQEASSTDGSKPEALQFVSKEGAVPEKNHAGTQTPNQLTSPVASRSTQTGTPETQQTSTQTELSSREATARSESSNPFDAADTSGDKPDTEVKDSTSLVSVSMISATEVNNTGSGIHDNDVTSNTAADKPDIIPSITGALDSMLAELLKDAEPTLVARDSSGREDTPVVTPPECIKLNAESLDTADVAVNILPLEPLIIQNATPVLKSGKPAPEGKAVSDSDFVINGASEIKSMPEVPESNLGGLQCVPFDTEAAIVPIVFPSKVTFENGVMKTPEKENSLPASEADEAEILNRSIVTAVAKIGSEHTLKLKEPSSNVSSPEQVAKLSSYPWYWGSLSTPDAEEHLCKSQRIANGLFLIRKDECGDLTLSFVRDKQIYHHKILRTSEGYYCYLEGEQDRFADLELLVKCHRGEEGILRTKLSSHVMRPGFRRKSDLCRQQ